AGFYSDQKKWAEAIEVQEHLLKAKPDAVNAHLNIGWYTFQMNGDVDRAEKEVKIWLAAPPKDAPVPNTSFAHYALGRIYEKQRKAEAAHAEYQTAVAINPKNEDAKKALAALK